MNETVPTQKFILASFIFLFYFIYLLLSELEFTLDKNFYFYQCHLIKNSFGESKDNNKIDVNLKRRFS